MSEKMKKEDQKNYDEFIQFYLILFFFRKAVCLPQYPGIIEKLVGLLPNFQLIN